jgi:hypothetical protein
VVELVGGEGLAKPLESVLVLATFGSSDLLRKGALLAELGQQRVVHEEQDVLLEVVRFRLALKFLCGRRVTREDALEDAQLAVRSNVVSPTHPTNNHYQIKFDEIADIYSMED